MSALSLQCCHGRARTLPLLCHVKARETAQHPQSLQSSTSRSKLQPHTGSGQPATPFTLLARTGQLSRSLHPKHHHIQSLVRAAAWRRLQVPELVDQAGITLSQKAPGFLAESKGNPSSPGPSWCCLTAALFCWEDLLPFLIFWPQDLLFSLA